MKDGSHVHTRGLGTVVDQPCLDPQFTCCQELDGASQVFRRSPQLVGGCLITGVSVAPQREQS